MSLLFLSAMHKFHYHYLLNAAEVKPKDKIQYNAEFRDECMYLCSHRQNSPRIGKAAPVHGMFLK